MGNRAMKKKGLGEPISLIVGAAITGGIQVWRSFSAYNAALDEQHRFRNDQPKMNLQETQELTEQPQPHSPVFNGQKMSMLTGEAKLMGDELAEIRDYAKNGTKYLRALEMWTKEPSAGLFDGMAKAAYLTATKDSEDLPAIRYKVKKGKELVQKYGDNMILQDLAGIAKRGIGDATGMLTTVLDPTRTGTVSNTIAQSTPEGQAWLKSIQDAAAAGASQIRTASTMPAGAMSLTPTPIQPAIVPEDTIFGLPRTGVIAGAVALVAGGVLYLAFSGNNKPQRQKRGLSGTRTSRRPKKYDL